MYFNAWVRDSQFLKALKEAWDVQIEGSPMFSVVNKLTNVKIALIRWQKSKPPVPSRIQKAREELDKIQTQLLLLLNLLRNLLRTSLLNCCTLKKAC